MNRLMLLVGVVGLSACSNAPSLRTPSLAVGIPDAWPSTDAVAIDTAWWRSIGGAELDSLVREGLRANHDLAIAAANVRASRAAATIAGADRWPQLSARADLARRKQIFVGLPIPGSEVPKSFSSTAGLFLDASWEIDLWNRLGEQQKAAVADLQASQADLAGARLALAGGVVRAWLDLTESEQQRALAARALEAYEQTGTIAMSRYERGLTPSVDVHLTRANRENAAALLALREEQARGSARALELLLGRYPAGVIAGASELPSTPQTVPGGLPAELVLRRPDLLAAERKVAAARSRVAVAQRNRLPQIRLTGSAGTMSNELGDLLDGDFSVWSLAGSLLQPIFQGGRLRAVIAQNAARHEVALSGWIRAVLVAFSEVEAALSSELWLREREEHLARAAVSAQAASRLAEDRYRQGLGDLSSLLDAQRRALDAEGQWLGVRNARLQARVGLHLALGGGFEAAPSRAAEFLSDSASASNPPRSE